MPLMLPFTAMFISKAVLGAPVLASIRCISGALPLSAANARAKVSQHSASQSSHFCRVCMGEPFCGRVDNEHQCALRP